MQQNAEVLHLEQGKTEMQKYKLGNNVAEMTGIIMGLSENVDTRGILFALLNTGEVSVGVWRLVLHCGDF